MLKGYFLTKHVSKKHFWCRNIIQNLQWAHITHVTPFLSKFYSYIRDLLKFLKKLFICHFYIKIKTILQHFRGKKYCYTYSPVRPCYSHHLPELPFMTLSSKITIKTHGSESYGQVK